MILFVLHVPLQALVLDDLPVSTNINLVEKNMDNDSMVRVSCIIVQVHSCHVITHNADWE